MNRRISLGSRAKYRRGDTIFGIINAIVMCVIMVVTLYPVLNTVAISFNDGIDAVRGGIKLWPRVFSTKSYDTIFVDETIYNAFCITVGYRPSSTSSSPPCSPTR